ncbi:SBBP repeat-containing protein [Taibaiella chishuiensis]|uniref:Putative secreted protein (Por secretion system target) n=1 Tax=Taibaiella chishuiensis TaxID=1434707 RepID=A0A2P8CZL1_9BACT|nr:SBBP repeat-containing protein [Taibaiella chishuiensis]PSK90402.1 putative secreted protein (Por secretion system target) [Taibaiella chishuiensis]
MKQINTLYCVKTFRSCCRSLLFLSCLLLPAFAGRAQNISLNWAKGIGSTDLIGSGTATVDGAGNVYTAGYFMGTTDFDPGPGTANLTANGIDMFLAKYDNNGNYLWAKKIGAASYNDQAYAIALDNAGNAYITGIFAATVDFDPGAGTANLVSNGASDIFIAKYDGAGNYVWARNIGGSDWDYGQSITLDNTGNVYVTGSFVDTAYFGATATANSVVSAGSTDVVLAKYDNNGNFIWGKAVGGSSSDDGQKVTTDAAGNVYVAGRYMLTADFDPGPGTANLVAGGATDIFLAKYSATGAYIWAKGIGGTGYDAPSDLIADAAGHLYTVGSFAGTVDFDPGTGTANLTSNSGLGDAYVAKYDTSGAYVWAKQAGPAGAANGANANAVVLGAGGDVYFTGNFNGTVDFDPGAGTANLTATSYKDIFVAKYNAAGNYLWAGRMGGIPISAASNCGGRTISRNTAGQVYVAGYFSGTVDFDPGPGNVNVEAAIGGSTFIMKLADGCPSYSTLTQTHCDSFSFHNVTYTTSGVYVDTLNSVFGCDSIVTLNLTINHSTVNPVITGAYCDSVTFNGVTYHTTGVYTQHYFSFNGCDSNKVYDVTIKGQSSSSQLDRNSCGPYVFNGTTYPSSGTFPVTLTNVQGCDSLVTLNLTVNPPPVATVIKTGSVLTVNNADAYQWINCADRSVIAGANSQTYTVTATGSYAAVITKNDCRDTSDCITVDVGTGIADLDAVNRLQFYPNPASAGIHILTQHPLRQATIRLSNVIGQVLQEQRGQSGSNFYLDIGAYAAGVYLVEVTEGDKASRRKIVKQ